MSAAGSITVTKLQRADHGELEARITLPGSETVAVTRRYGSWGIQHKGEQAWIEVLPMFAAELQDRARPFETAERAAAARASVRAFVADCWRTPEQIKAAGLDPKALEHLVETGEVERLRGRYRIAQLVTS